MASPIVKGNTFGATDTVTSTTLNNIVDNAAFKDFDGSTEAFNVSGSTDIGTCLLAGGLAVKTTTGQLEIKDNGVTLAKMATQADQTVLGNVSGGTDVPTAVPIVGAAGILVNNDSLGTDDTKGATQGNIKAFVEKFKPNIVQTVKTDTASTSGTSFATLMSVSITPKFENSKFKISFSVCTSSSNSNYGPSFRLQRGGSDLTSFLGSSDGSRVQTTISTHFPQAATSQTVSHFTALDSTSYSGLTAITFDLDWAMTVAGTGYLNRSKTDSDTSSYTRSVSQLMVEEIYQ
jgi:hypothetical protein